MRMWEDIQPPVRLEEVTKSVSVGRGEMGISVQS